MKKQIVITGLIALLAAPAFARDNRSNYTSARSAATNHQLQKSRVRYNNAAAAYVEQEARALAAQNRQQANQNSLRNGEANRKRKAQQSRKYLGY